MELSSISFQKNDGRSMGKSDRKVIILEGRRYSVNVSNIKTS